MLRLLKLGEAQVRWRRSGDGSAAAEPSVDIPDITRRHMAVNIRKFVLRAHGLDELVAAGTLIPQAARFLEAAVAAGLSILVSGGTQARKTTLLNCS